jgi:hypothetical protein
MQANYRDFHKTIITNTTMPLMPRKGVWGFPKRAVLGVEALGFLLPSFPQVSFHVRGA